jgi:hypothetical protein
MDKDNAQFESEFKKRLGRTSFKLLTTKNGNDYIISNDEASKALLVRAIHPCDDKKQNYLRHPNPAYNAEAVLIFRFKTDGFVYPHDFYSFIWRNPISGRTDSLIFKTTDIKDCLARVGVRSTRSGYYRLLLWIFPGNFIFAANDLSGEGEWYLLGGVSKGNDPERCMGKDTERDFSRYLNRWDQL